MHYLLLWAGRLAGLAGVLVTLLAFAVRAQGRYVLGNYQAGTLLMVGIALMVIGCLAYVGSIAERRPPTL